MITNDPIADMLNRIRNAHLARKEEVIIPSSKMKLTIAKILKREGFIKEVRIVDEKGAAGGGSKNEMVISLKYKKGQPVIQKLKRVSSPGRRMYVSRYDLPYVLDNLGIAIVSTSSGLMTNKEARNKKIGGEIICEVY